jgi:sulfotransferase family protein
MEPTMQPPIFLISAPRSGSTLLARMLGSHSAIFAPAEPHLMPPLAHLGFHERVDQAPYDPVITQQGLRSFVSLLPGGEADWLAALRRATDHLYERALAPSGRALFLDKTPANALVLDFLVKLYPDARYVVLTRHPMAVWSSYVDSFFDGDAAAAHARNPVLERYVPALARFLRERPVPLVHVRYEALVSDPESGLRELCAFLGVAYEPGMVEYGSAEASVPRVGRGLGDPITVNRETRPTTGSIAKWAEALRADPARLAQCRAIAERLADADLALWGTPGPELRKTLAELTPAGAGAPRPALTRYSLERRLLVRLRRNIHHNALGRLVRRVRTACDVLLR